MNAFTRGNKNVIPYLFVQLLNRVDKGIRKGTLNRVEAFSTGLESKNRISTKSVCAAVLSIELQSCNKPNLSANDMTCTSDATPGVDLSIRSHCIAYKKKIVHTDSLIKRFKSRF